MLLTMHSAQGMC